MEKMIYILMLNDMRSLQIENLTPVAWSDDAAPLEELLAREKVEQYSEPGENHYGPTRWGKSYRKDGPLEWYNSPAVGGGVIPYEDLVVIGGVLHQAPRRLGIPNISSLP